MCQALLEIMEPEISKIVDEATENVKREAETAKREAKKAKEDIVESITAMLKSGKFSAEEIKTYMPGVPLNKIKEIENNLKE